MISTHLSPTLLICSSVLSNMLWVPPSVYFHFSYCGFFVFFFLALIDSLLYLLFVEVLPEFLSSTLMFGEHPYDCLNSLSGKFLISTSLGYFVFTLGGEASLFLFLHLGHILCLLIALVFLFI